jgi:biopolymer transport protein TolR
MAFGRLERTPLSQPMSEINMTPLIDVMLVLLVIFMLTAPLLVRGIKVDLPASQSGKALKVERFAAVSVDVAGQAFLEGQALPDAELEAALQQIAKQQPDAEVQLRVDAAVPYARVVVVMGLAQKAGLTRIGFVTESAKAVAPSLTETRP